jgi:segregation and condensation protein A
LTTNRTFTSADAPADFESVVQAYPVRLEVFEGPLDLLLHLIRKHQLDIYDIPIALITRQYLDYLNLMQELDLDIAGDFLVMSATLIHIKSRTLLPRPDPTQDDPEEDPREALVRRLLEHQQFKAAAELLHDREIQRSAQWGRPDGSVNEAVGGDPPEPEVEIDLFSLMAAFRQVIERARKRPQMYLPAEYISLESRIALLMDRLSTTDACGFEELFADVQTKPGIVVTFLALLEMIRLKLVRVFQQGNFGAIRVYKREAPEGSPDFVRE